MADYIGITEAQSNPFAPLTSELVKQLRDNPIAIAEGAAGAPRVRGTARNHNKIGEVTATADVTELALTNLPAHNDIIIFCEEFKQGADEEFIRVELQISDNNGISWVSLLTSGSLSSTTPSRAQTRVFTGRGGDKNFRVGTTFNDTLTLGFSSGGFSLSGQVNAVRVVRTTAEGTFGAGAKIEVYALAEGYLP